MAVALTPATGLAAPAAESGVGGLIVSAVVRSGWYGETDAESELPVTMSVANHTGRDLRSVEARQALDGELSGAVITGAPVASHGSVEYDARGLMWQGDLARNQVAAVSYSLTAPAGSTAGELLRELRSGARLDTTITATCA